MHEDEASVRDEWPALSGSIGKACAFRKFANIAQVVDGKKEALLEGAEKSLEQGGEPSGYKL